jgi:hypothetical protein
MKIVSTGKTLSSPEYHKKKKALTKRKFIIWSLLLLALLVGFVLISRIERLQISSVEVSGANVVAREQVESSIKNVLSGNYLWLIPRSNAFIYPRQEVRESLMSEFSRFSQVSASLNGLNALEVSVAEREPFALYCADVSNTASVSSCYFLDASGFIFDEAPFFSGVVYFIYSLEEPLEEPLGTVYMEPEEFKKITSFVESLNSFGLKPLALEANDRELKVIFQRSLYLVWKRDAELKLIYANLEAFLNTNEIKSQRDFLELVRVLDLRIENQVRYRFE